MKRISRVSLIVDHLSDDPSAVTTLIGFKPTAVMSCGFSSLGSRSYWVYDFHKPDALVEDQLAAMAHFLELREENVRRAVARYPTWIQIDLDDRDWIWSYEPSGPRSGEIQLNRKVVGTASRLGLGFQIGFSTGLVNNNPDTDAAKAPE